MTFTGLTENQIIAGFATRALYLNGFGQPMGARFFHQETHLTLDLIEIQTVPQAFLTVHTHPVSNQGEPHTQEHLVLGKGNTGRALAAQETMSMIESTAYTQQLRTCYPFAANSGVEEFFAHLERMLNALLHPDYTDEEIRREVCHYGVKTNTAGQLELEEKGTIYTEMVSATAQPGYRVYREMGRLLYGPAHPCSYDSGGHPDAIRTMQPEDIRRFHAANYHLANMELIVSLPEGLPVSSALAKFDAVLTRLAAGRPPRPAADPRQLDHFNPAPPGVTRLIDFPSHNPRQSAPAYLSWPLMPRLNAREESLADLFTHVFAGDPSTNLYKLFIDSRTRVTPLNARTVSMGFDNEVHAQFYLYIPDLEPAQATAERLREIVSLSQAEMARVAGFADGSEELREFHSRIEAYLLRVRRSADKLINSPPGFGGRGSQSIWPQLLRDLNDEPGFVKNLLQPELYDWLGEQLASGENLWRSRLAAWGLLEQAPYIVAARPSEQLLEQAEEALQSRLAAETRQLRIRYGLADDQQALQRFAAEYDAATQALAAAEEATPAAQFIADPPLTLDDALDAEVTTLLNGIPFVAGRFNGMTSAKAGLALNAACLGEATYPYLPALPMLLTGTGMTLDGELLSHEEATQRMRREILGISASWSANPVNDRLELVFSAAGNTREETQRSLDWLAAAMFAPNWTVDNLPRLRDMLQQSLNQLRTMTQRSEEHWVDDPARAWTYQESSQFLAAGCFLTQTFLTYRFRWRLMEPAAAAIPDVLADLEHLEAELPPDTREADRKKLLALALEDLFYAPAQALADLEAARQTLLRQPHARAYLTASPAACLELQPHLEALLAQLAADPAPADPAPPAPPDRRRPVARRLPEGVRFVGLLTPGMQTGVHLHSAPGPNIEQFTEESLLDYLAFKLFAGAGAHGVFMKTWAAGLAYSNGLRSSAMEGRNSYYAERTPLLPQTMRFVIEQIQQAPRHLTLTEYAFAQAFSGTRAAGSFESRTSALAGDLADQVGPEVVRHFRRSLLALRHRPQLNEELYSRLDRLYSAVLPGYAKPHPDVPGATYFVIGNEKQLAAWEEYLGEPVHRLYARDFWLLD